MLAVLAPGVVLAADARDNVQVVDVAAAVGVAVALTVWKGKREVCLRTGYLRIFMLDS